MLKILRTKNPITRSLNFVIPAKAGIQLHTRPKKGRVREKTSSLFLLSFVIPVKTGIHWFSMFLTGARWKLVELIFKQLFHRLDTGVRRYDEYFLFSGLKKNTPTTCVFRNFQGVWKFL